MTGVAMPIGIALDDAAPGIITPAKLKSGFQPGDVSDQARSDGLNLPAASWRFTSSSACGPVRSPSRLM